MHRSIATEHHAVMAAGSGSPAATIDFRDIRLRDQRARVFAAFRGLEEGQVLHLASDQSLESIYFDFVVETPDAFHWEYMEAGPARWRATVTRLEAHPAQAGHRGSRSAGARRADALE